MTCSASPAASVVHDRVRRSMGAERIRSPSTSTVANPPTAIVVGNAGRGGRCGGVPRRDVAVDVRCAHPERVGSALVAEVDAAREGRAGEPRRPRATVDGDLDVVAGDRAVVPRAPPDAEALVALALGERGHADERRGLVREELVGERLAELRPRAVVAERPDPRAAQRGAIDEVVAQPQRRGVVVVQLPPRGDAAVRGRARLLRVRGPRRLLDRVVPAPVLVDAGRPPGRTSAPRSRRTARPRGSSRSGHPTTSTRRGRSTARRGSPSTARSSPCTP